jgi:hypothetical protein
MNSNGNGVTLEGAAYRLGQEAFAELNERAGHLVAWEKVRCETLNQSELASLKARFGCANERRKELKEIVRFDPPEDLSSLRRQRWYHWGIALVLVVSGVFFAHLALAPFGLGWEAWAFSLGIGLVAAFWTDKTLEKTHSERLVRCLCAVALLGSMAGLLVMALLRGDILALYLNTAAAGGAPGDMQNAAVAADFYAHAIPKLQFLMALLAVAMELGSGMAVFEAMKFDLTTHERAVQARRDLESVEEEMIAIIGRITHLENEPAINEAEFYRNFYLGLFERIKRNSLLLAVVVAGLLAGATMVPTARAQSADRNNPQVSTSGQGTRIVVALDLTASVATSGYDGKTEFEKNVLGACALIPRLSPGSHITVFGITDQSFSRPDVLLDREVPGDKGPLLFQDRTALAKARMADELKRVSLIKPSYQHTDIFGILAIAADVLQGPTGSRKVLVIFSDMRNSTNDLDLERPATVSVREALRKAEQRHLVMHLTGVELYVLGVDGAGKSIAYWNSLKEFWAEYFRKTGAGLKAYSALREVSDSAPVN